MTKPTSKPRILIVDDDPHVGDLLKKRVTDQFGFQVCIPHSHSTLQNTLVNEAFDTAVVDSNLSNWNMPIRVFGTEVWDGIDFAQVYCEFHPQSLIVLFGPSQVAHQESVQRRIESLSRCNVKTIERPLPLQESEIQSALEVLKPEIREIEILHEANPIFQASEPYEGLPAGERLLRSRLLYRQASQQSEKWVNYNLKEYGDSSWTVLCGGNLQKDYHGEPLNGSHPSDVDVNIRNRYPGQQELKKLEQTENTSSFVLWNTGGSSILIKQFETQFGKIPASLIDDFGMAVAESCAEAYKEGEAKRVIDWCRKWPPTRPQGQLDVLRSIFTNLDGDRPRSIKQFSQHCKKEGVHRVVDVYRARVEQVTEKENTAHIELTNVDKDENFTAPFDLKELKRKGIKELDQCFEYTVYLDQLGNSFGRIELTE